jgi:hypothetical protein
LPKKNRNSFSNGGGPSGNNAGNVGNNRLAPGKRSSCCQSEQPLPAFPSGEEAPRHFVPVLTPGVIESRIVRDEIRLARQEGKTISPVKGYE